MGLQKGERVRFPVKTDENYTKMIEGVVIAQTDKSVHVRDSEHNDYWVSKGEVIRVLDTILSNF